MAEQAPPLVAHVIYSLGTGGLENGLVNIINRCPPERYRHVIICLTEARAFAQRITVPGVEVLELHKRDGKDLPVYWRLFKLLRRLQPAILHTRNLATLDAQALGILLPGVKQVHGEHGRDIYDLDGLNRKYARLRRVMRTVVDCYIAVSQDLNDWLLDTIRVEPERVHQIYNGVDHKKFSPREGARPAVFPAEYEGEMPFLVVGTVGRLAAVKDQALILRAAALLIEREPGLAERLRVLIVGDGPLRDELQQQVADLGLSKIAWLPGDREDIPVLLQAMDIFVLPSLAEGISNTILEAMSASLPVVATRTGGNPELIDHERTGLLFEVGDAHGFADSLQRLLDDQVLRSELANHAVNEVRERFDWSKTVANYISVYDEVLGKTQREHEASSAVDRVNKLEAG